MNIQPKPRGNKMDEDSVHMNTLHGDTLMTKIFTDQDEAFCWMKLLNGEGQDNNIWVLTKGPNENEFWVMPMTEAIECGFFYEWAA